MLQMTASRNTSHHEESAAGVQEHMPVLPLSMVRAGEPVCIKKITGKDDMRRYIASLGFVEDTETTVITETGGNVIVAVKGTRLAISKRLARRVLTVPSKKRGRKS
ncbi:MAG: ferrous iron transport protein A [Sporolactobacillus sp.]|jgi:ferrous iron transport protein A|nr:ferrous iron transport protein A [Sporolactobacillus sp.]